MLAASSIFLKISPSLLPHLPQLGHSWDVMLVWRKGNIKKTVSVLLLQVGWLYWALILLGLAFCLPSASVFLVFLVLYMCSKMFLFTSFPLSFSELNLVGLALDLMTWLTNHRPSVLWHCWLGHTTHKIVSEITHNMWSGTLNPTIPTPLSLTV